MLQNGVIVLLGVYLVEMRSEIRVCSSWLVDKISHAEERRLIGAIFFAACRKENRIYNIKTVHTSIACRFWVQVFPPSESRLERV